MSCNSSLNIANVKHQLWSWASKQNLFRKYDPIMLYLHLEHSSKVWLMMANTQYQIQSQNQTPFNPMFLQDYHAHPWLLKYHSNLVHEHDTNLTLYAASGILDYVDNIHWCSSWLNPSLNLGSHWKLLFLQSFNSQVRKVQAHFQAQVLFYPWWCSLTHQLGT